MPTPPPPAQHRFKPGQSGNPNGRPPGRRFIDELEEFIDEKQARPALKAKYLSMLLAGQFAAWKEYLDRRDGKPKDETPLGGDDGEDGRPKGITIPAHDPRYAPPEGGRPAKKRDRKRHAPKRAGHRRPGGNGENVPDTGGDP